MSYSAQGIDGFAQINDLASSVPLNPKLTFSRFILGLVWDLQTIFINSLYHFRKDFGCLQNYGQWGKIKIERNECEGEIRAEKANWRECSRMPQDPHCYQKRTLTVTKGVAPNTTLTFSLSTRNKETLLLIKSRVDVMKQQQQLTRLHVKPVIVACGSRCSTNYAMMNTCHTSSL